MPLGRIPAETIAQHFELCRYLIGKEPPSAAQDAMSRWGW